MQSFKKSHKNKNLIIEDANEARMNECVFMWLQSMDSFNVFECDIYR